MNTKLLVDRFLSWPLPESLCSDPCASMPGYPHRTGTNLMTAEQAEAMIEYVIAAPRQPEGEGLEVAAWQDAENPLYTTGERRQMHAWATDGYPIVELCRLSDAQRAIAELEAERDTLRQQLAELRAQLLAIASAEPRRHTIEWAKAMAATGNNEAYAKWREAFDQRDRLAGLLSRARGCIDAMGWDELETDIDAILAQPAPAEGEAVEVVAWQDAENPSYTTGERRQMHGWATDGYPIRELMAVSQHQRIVAQRDAKLAGEVEALREITDDYSERFDMESPSTNPGMKSVVQRARAALAAAGVEHD